MTASTTAPYDADEIESARKLFEEKLLEEAGYEPVHP